MTKSELTKLNKLKEESRRLKGLVRRIEFGQRRAQEAPAGKMVSRASRRRAVGFLLERGFPRVRACRVCGISRHTRQERRPELRARVLDLAKANPGYGFRRIHALVEPGVNLKAVHRDLARGGLALRHRRRRRLVVPKVEGAILGKANEAWCLASAMSENGRHVRILGVLDCFTRKCLLLKAAPSFPAFAVERELEWLCLVHGKPEVIVSDNGPEFRATTLWSAPESLYQRLN